MRRIAQSDMGTALWTQTPLRFSFRSLSEATGVGRHAVAPSQGGAMHRLLISCLVGLVLSLNATAQLPTSTLNRTVTDPQGCKSPAPKVVVTPRAHGEIREARSAGDDRF